MIRRRSVALLIETSNAYARGLLSGIVDYIHSHDAWSIYLPEQERAAPPPEWIRRWKGDGIIARIETKEIAESLQKTGIPVVDVSAARHYPGVPWVETNDAVIATLAAEHLLQRGFKHLGFCGDADFNWSKWRRNYFRDEVEKAGCDFHFYETAVNEMNPSSLDNERKRIAQWLKNLPRPIGLLAAYDIKAQLVLDVCRELEIAVPEEIAVLGVDNDELLCSLADPPLSSVVPNSRKTGYEAARLLDQMMNGEEVSKEGLLVEPLGVETRQSTDILAIDDTDVAAALQFIRQHAFAGINVNDIVRHVNISRRVLETRFRNVIGRTPHEEILRQRITRVKKLLAETDMTLRQIATRTGFEHTEYLTVAFKRETKQTPTQFRKDVTNK